VSEDELEVLAYEPSPIGMFCLRRRPLPGEPGTLVTEITLDHQFLMSSHAADSERALARRAIEWHGGDALDVLVGGLGLGCTAHEALASARVARVLVVELLAPVADWLARGLLPLAGALRADPRFALARGDVYRRLAEPPARLHDLVLVDVDHSPDERLAEGDGSFYTEAGLAAARRHLAPGGVLGVWSYAESPAFEAALRRVFADVRVEPVRFENRAAGGTEVNWLFFARG
jgi:spermidine synthase